MPDLSIRVRVPEMMDDPKIDPEVHAAALRGLRRINALCRSDAILWPSLRELARRLAPRPIRILDVATGSGDLPFRLAKRFQRAGLAAHIHGCDISETAIATAKQLANHSLEFFQHDVFADAIRGVGVGGYDAVTCSLFLHHLDPPEARVLFQRMSAATRHLVLVNDLRRCRMGWWGAYIGARLLTRSPIVHYDGPVSVAAAFTPEEAVQIAADAGLVGAIAEWRWPWRFLLKWQKLAT